MKLVGLHVTSKVVEKGIRVDERRDLVFEDVLRFAVDRSNKLIDRAERREWKDSIG